MSALTPPDQLKQIKPYLTLATQLEQKNEKVIAYYCRLYSVQQGMQINKNAPECKKFLLLLMDVLENTKKQNPNEEAIYSDIVGQALVEKYALKMFEKADDDDRQSRFNKNLVKQFYSAGLLFDILNCFGELSEDLVLKKQYAKKKAMYLNQCFQTGETPKPGPLIEDNDLNEEQNFGQGYNEPTNNMNDLYKPTTFNNQNDSNISPNKDMSYEQRPSSSKNTNHNQYVDTSYYNDMNQSSQTTNVSPEMIQKAQKFCKHVQSALQYDDVQTAITNLEQCLKLLKTGKV